MKNLLADRTTRIDASGIRKVFALAADLEDPINFSIGQPDFDVPEEIKEAAIEAIRGGRNRYSQSSGDAELKAKIASRVRTDIGWEKPSVLITSGVSGGILLSLMTLINPGDEVILPDPYFVIYKHVINLLGGKCVFVDSYPDFRLPAAAIADAVTDRTKLIIVNSPNNPTGAVYSEDELKAVAEIAAKKDIPVLTDEIYEEFTYEGQYPSIAEFYDKSIILKGFGKSYAMTGWRMGCAVVAEPLKSVLNEMTKIQQYTFVCAPTPFQRAAIAAMDCDITQLVDSYRAKRNLLCDELAGKFEVTRPGGAFYAFVKAPGRTTATEFAKKAIENNVLVIPGSVFSEKGTHFRISYATSDERIRQGVDILRRLA